MALEVDHERPLMKLPYERVERAGPLLVWILAALPVAFLLLLGTRLVDALQSFTPWLAGLFILVFAVAVAEYLVFEQRYRVDDSKVVFRRRSLFGSDEWTERLANYTGLAVMTPTAGDAASGAETSHWSRRAPPQFIRLVSRTPSRSVTLWEFDARDFPGEVSRRLKNFSELLNMPALTSRGGLRKE